MTKDLTTGKPAAVLWRFCLPLFGSILFQQLYSLADSFVAGHYLGESALAAVGNSYEITLFFIAFSFGSGIGCSVTVSQLFGAKKLSELKTAVSTALLAMAGLCLLLMGLGFLFLHPLLALIHTPDSILADSACYLRIYLLSLPFVLFYNAANGIFSALGDSRTPFLFLAVSSLGNIAMDILFVTVLQMGVSGVAWATLICQGCSCIPAMMLVFRRLAAMQTPPAKLFSIRLLRRIAAVAVPSILQQTFISAGNIILQRLINGFDSDHIIAGYAAGVKLNNLVITSFTTLANGVSSFAAQNLGAGKTARIRQGFRAGVGLVWLLCIPLTALYLLGGRALTAFFLDVPTAQAIETGTVYLRILSPFYFVVSVKLVADGVLRGTGSMNQFMAATFTDLVLRVVLAAVLSRHFGATGIWMAWPVGWTVATCLSLAFYRTVVGKLMRNEE